MFVTGATIVGVLIRIIYMQEPENRTWSKPLETVDLDVRTVAQNRKLWPMIRDVSRQVEWEVNGHKCYLDEHDWADIFTAALRKHHRLTRGIDGGFVVLGMHTSRMSKQEMSDLFMIIESFGADKGVKWSDQAN